VKRRWAFVEGGHFKLEDRNTLEKPNGGMDKEEDDDEEKEEKIKLIFNTLKKDPENTMHQNTENYKRNYSHCEFEDISGKKRERFILFYFSSF
jgi:hypothetical protein